MICALNGIRRKLLPERPGEPLRWQQTGKEAELVPLNVERSVVRARDAGCSHWERTDGPGQKPVDVPSQAPLFFVPERRP